MELKTMGTFKSEVVVDVSKQDIIKLLASELKVPVITNSTECKEVTIYLKKNSKGIPTSINKKTVYYRNCGRGEEKYDHEEDVIITQNKEKVELYDAYLKIEKALSQSITL